MNIKNLKVGDKVFIKEDIEDWKLFGTLIYYPNMQTGVVKVTHISRDYFKVQDGIGYLYSAEMIDWEKTRYLKYIKNLLGVHDEEQDKVNSPSHYKLEGLDIESVDVIKSVLGKEKFIGWVWGNSLKYLLRQEKKNGIEDVKKAMKNLEWLVEILEKED